MSTVDGTIYGLIGPWTSNSTFTNDLTGLSKPFAVIPPTSTLFAVMMVVRRSVCNHKA